MIVIFKNEQGTLSVRPAFIGFIKNNIVRRVLCSLFFPLVFLCTVALNLLQAGIVSVYLIIRALWIPLAAYKLPWKCEIWHRPRTKQDANKRLN